VAAIDILRRGCSLELLHFHSQPFTSEASVLKIKKLAQIIKQYSTNPIALYLVPLLDIQQAVCARCREEYRTIHYRRFMMRVAEELARRTNSKAIVTGEAISQVASQTLTNLGAIEDVIRLSILRPLISCDKQAIIAKARTLGTYETSIEPHDDSCSLFASKHPSTRVSIEKLNVDDQGLEINKLVLSALDSMEKVIIK
jgi:thiamine biosynthesis protein ThiI